MNFRRILLPFLFLLALTLLAGCGSSGGGGGTTMTGIVVFESNRDVQPRVYKINADGSGLARLTEGPGSDTSPAVSVNGMAMLFSSD
jgi:hypothetical protein